MGGFLYRSLETGIPKDLDSERVNRLDDGKIPAEPSQMITKCEGTGI